MTALAQNGTALQRVGDALVVKDCRPRSSGGGLQACCPAHEDRAPSLSVSRRADDAGVVLHCHAGCQPEAVVDALGLSMPDLFDRPREPSTTTATVDDVQRSYRYVDEQGTLLFEVVRKPGKQFRQRRPDGAGGWVWSLGETRRVPYRLPQLLEAVAVGRTVYIAEGEKDVDRLVRQGVTATCNPGGAGKWRPEFAQHFAGATVVVVADRDEPGRAHAEQVRSSLQGMAAAVSVVEAAQGKDVSDHLDAGLALEQLVPAGTPAAADGAPVDEQVTVARKLRLTRASEIEVRPVRWLWQDRVPLGSLALVAGREGIGKSTVGYTIAADVTRGRLSGQYGAQPRSVIVAATEDSWEHTIVPRLMAAGADLERVLRVDVTTSEGVETGLSLPRDLLALERAVREQDVALILLDPLMSRLDGALDTHKDAEVRLALEPLTALADRTGAAVLGLIHVNKGTSADPLTLIMGSRAFAAVARAVLFVMTDPEDETVRLLGQEKNNLGRTDLPTLTFQIVSAHVADTDEGPVFTGRVTWLGESERTIRQALETAGEGTDARSATGEAGDWLVDYLQTQGGTAESAAIKREGGKAGHSQDALKRARRVRGVETKSEGFPRRTWWSLAGTQLQSEQDSGSSPGESALTALTTPTAPTGDAVGAVSAVGAVGGVPREACTDCRDCGWPLASSGHVINCQSRPRQTA